MLSRSWGFQQIVNSTKSSLLCSCCCRRLKIDGRFISQNHVYQQKSKIAHHDIQARLSVDLTFGQDLAEHVYEGKSHKLGLRVYVWGVAAQGALGRASFLRPNTKQKQKKIDCRLNPHRLDFGEKHKVVDVSCGYGFTAFAVNSNSKDTHTPSVFGTGLNCDGQIGHHSPRHEHPLEMLASPSPIALPVQDGDSVVKVSCGRAHTLALTSSGTVYSLGNNAYGQCGRRVLPGEDYSRQTVYNKLQGMDGPVTQIECGQDTSFFVTSAGAVYTCGFGADGQTGRGHYGNESTIGRAGGDLEGVTVTKVACKADCVLALADSGDVFSWGNNEYRQLSLATDEAQLHTPRHLPLPASIGRVVDVAAAGTACFVLTEHGEVYSWGYGILGRGPKELCSEQLQLIPPPLLGSTALSPGTKVVSVFCGVHMATCVNDKGELFTWGKNVGGSLGLGHSNQQSFPIRVCLPGRVVKVGCGVDHMAVLARQL